MKGATVTKERLYPDFDIDQYWGADDDTNRQPDIVRIIVEIASLKDDFPDADKMHLEAVVQLQNYLETVGERWDQRLVGLAILGNEAYLMHLTQEDLRIREVYELSDDEDNDDNDGSDGDWDWDDGGNDNSSGMEREGRRQNDCWMSLFDPRVVQVLDEMYALSMEDDD